MQPVKIAIANHLQSAAALAQAAANDPNVGTGNFLQIVVDILTVLLTVLKSLTTTFGG